MKEISSLITTLEKELQPRTGTLCLETGSGEQTSFNDSELAIIKNRLKQVPILFRKDVNEYLVSVMFRLEFQGKIAKNDVTKLIDCKYNLQQFIRDPDIKAIQIMIETIASTFSCDVPTELKNMLNYFQSIYLIYIHWLLIIYVKHFVTLDYLYQ